MLATLAVVAVVTGVRVGVSQLGGGECDGQVRLSVAAAPQIAAAVQQSAAEWVGGSATVGGACVAVDVRAVDPADVAAVLSAEQKVSLAGAGAPRAGVTAPDVWVPDARTWLQRLRSAAPEFAFTEEGSLALSPVVMAMPEPVAKELGWPRRKLSYADLIAQITTSTNFRAGTVDPARDAAALSGLLALGATAATLDQRRPGTTNGLLRTLATDTSVLRDDLMAQLPQDKDDNSLAAGLGLAAMSESDVVTYNATRPPVGLAALYLEPAAVPLNYPFAVMPDLGQAQAEAAHQLYAALSAGAGFRGRLAQAGIRAPDGTAPAGFTAPAGAPKRFGPAQAAGSGEAAAATADGATIDRALAGWSAVVAPARILAIVDASASMRTPVPTARNATRMQLTLAAARGGLGLFSDDWQVGLWLFAGSGSDHRELVPIGPLTDKRDDVAGALGGIQPAGGDAGLYRTILDGYREVQDGWQAGRVNSVLLMTDGVGAGRQSGDIKLEELLAKLGAAKSADKPVQVIIVGVGDAVDRTPLERITRETGGGVFIAEDPAQIGAVFLEALSLRTTTPR
ncbi:VWA domain-containing protein [Actinoplanes sp. ATCC 53533]|uniref:VWA domain-containing protein n=1 Tax=Actinoplanes sp. ATCC 53533 TaxID=1288362 RepID=UPI000F7B285F|nr:VWA domain-containing protein [Actinoplanes sp. ATCC 53533]RSM58113.1 VWA domain-containing protein [Actinoplanes sp. ATCC 53533]